MEPILIGKQLPSIDTMQTILIWFLTIELLGLPGVAVISRVISDRRLVYALARPLGFLIFAYLSWLSGMAGVPLGARFLQILFASLLLVSLISLALRYGRNALHFFSPSLNSTALLLYFFVLGFYLAARMCNPEIFWGEKPMDFGFLNYFIRSDTLPPEDVWASGQVMNYYYFGSFAFALIHKVTGIDSAIGYNLSIVSIAGFFVVSTYSLFYLLGLRQRSWWCTLLLMFSANFMLLFEYFFRGSKLNSHLFWKTTRVYTSPSFSEFPLWSFLFADLHAHVIAMPFFVLFLCLCKKLGEAEHKAAHIALLCFSWGTLAIINAWDFLAAAVILGLVLLLKESQKNIETTNSRLLATAKAFVRASAKELVLAALALAYILPSFLGTGLSSSHGWGFVPPKQSNTALQLFSMHGHWLLVFVLACMSLRIRFRDSTRYSRYTWIAVMSAVIFSFGLLQTQGYSAPWDIAQFVAVLYTFAHFSASGTSSDFASLAIVSACFLLMFSEVVFLADRMNTIFKFHTIAWILLGIGSLKYFAQGHANARHYGLRSLRAVAVCSLPLSGLILIYIYFFTHLHWTVAGGYPTLNGLNYLKRKNPQEAGLIYWMRDSIEGDRTLMEAVGPSYGGFARLSSLSGLKSVLGWKHHVAQRGTSRKEIQRRSDAVREVYTSTHLKTRLRYLLQYDVDYLAYSKLENETYGEDGRRQLLEHPDIFELAYREKNSFLFKISKESLRNYLGLHSTEVLR